MSPDLVASELSIVAAVIPLIVTLIALFRARMERVKAALDSPSLKVLMIKRYPVSPDALKEIKKSARISYTVLIFLLLLFYLGIYVGATVFLVYFNGAYSAYFLVILIIDFILFIMAIYLLTKTRISKIASSLRDDLLLKIYIFAKVEVRIESEFHYLFNKCHETLRTMKYYVMELNEGEGTGSVMALQFKSIKFSRTRFHYAIRHPFVFYKEALIRPFSSSVFAIDENFNRIQINIDKIENTEGSFQINLEFGENMSILLKSKITNRFIELLISKPSNRDDKT